MTMSMVRLAIGMVPVSLLAIAFFGFNVYGREPGKVYATSGTQPGLHPNVSGDLINGEPGLFTERSERFILDGKGYRPTKNAT